MRGYTDATVRLGQGGPILPLPFVHDAVRESRSTNANKRSKLRRDPVRPVCHVGGLVVLNLSEALAVRNEQKGGAVYPLEARVARFRDFGVNVRVFSPGEPNGLYHAEAGQEGFLVSRASAR